MSTVTLPPAHVREFGPESAGTLMTLREFDRAEFVDGWRYELINGVLVVSPIPDEAERSPNDELGYWLRSYRDRHPQGASLDCTVFEQTVKTRRNRRRADRAIWAGLGRPPRKGETPTVIAEFVSAGKRDRKRDYEEKRDEYMEIRVSEYWIIDRFRRTLTVFTRHGKRIQQRVFTEKQTYSTKLLPGFELPLAKLLAIADRWAKEEADEE
jgi:Uma2 family endonuclease